VSEKCFKIAEILLKNTVNVFIKEDLQNYIEETGLIPVLECIANDGYDVSEFGLWEIPAENVYCFGSHINGLDGSEEAYEKCEWFDVYTDWDFKGDTVIGYISGGVPKKASCIKEAIQKYEMG